MDNPDKLNCKNCWNCGNLQSCLLPYPDPDRACWEPNRNVMVVNSFPGPVPGCPTLNETDR